MGFLFPKIRKKGGFWNPKGSMVYGYGKYKIPDPSGKRKGTDTQYDSWEEHLVMVLVLYALFYVFLVLFIFFDSFKQESNKLELSGKEEKKLVNGEGRLTRDI